MGDRKSEENEGTGQRKRESEKKKHILVTGSAQEI